MPDDHTSQHDALRQHIVTLEAQLAALREQLGHEESVSQSGAGAIATSGGSAAGAGGAAVGRDVGGHVVVAGNGATIVIGEQPIPMTAVQRGSALGRYLSHVISRNRYLQWQGIRFGGRLVNIALEHIRVYHDLCYTVSSREGGTAHVTLSRHSNSHHRGVRFDEPDRERV
jgi:hypothetical protein